MAEVSNNNNINKVSSSSASKQLSKSASGATSSSISFLHTNGGKGALNAAGRDRSLYDSQNQQTSSVSKQKTPVPASLVRETEHSTSTRSSSSSSGQSSSSRRETSARERPAPKNYVAELIRDVPEDVKKLASTQQAKFQARSPKSIERTTSQLVFYNTTDAKRYNILITVRDARRDTIPTRKEAFISSYQLFRSELYQNLLKQGAYEVGTATARLCGKVVFKDKNKEVRSKGTYLKLEVESGLLWEHPCRYATAIGNVIKTIRNEIREMAKGLPKNNLNSYECIVTLEDNGKFEPGQILMKDHLPVRRGKNAEEEEEVEHPKADPSRTLVMFGKAVPKPKPAPEKRKRYEPLDIVFEDDKDEIEDDDDDDIIAKKKPAAKKHNEKKDKAAAAKPPQKKKSQEKKRDKGHRLDEDDDDDAFEYIPSSVPEKDEVITEEMIAKEPDAFVQEDGKWRRRTPEELEEYYMAVITIADDDGEEQPLCEQQDEEEQPMQQQNQPPPPNKDSKQKAAKSSSSGNKSPVDTLCEKLDKAIDLCMELVDQNKRTFDPKRKSDICIADVEKERAEVEKRNAQNKKMLSATSKIKNNNVSWEGFQGFMNKMIAEQNGQKQAPPPTAEEPPAKKQKVNEPEFDANKVKQEPKDILTANVHKDQKFNAMEVDDDAIIDLCECEHSDRSLSLSLSLTV